MDEKTNTNSNNTADLIAKRFATQEPARMEIYGKKEILFCRMNNLSATGAFFEILNATYTPKVGDLVRITINLKKVNASHLINGEIIWSKGYGVGITFIKQKELFNKLSK